MEGETRIELVTPGLEGRWLIQFRQVLAPQIQHPGGTVDEAHQIAKLFASLIARRKSVNDYFGMVAVTVVIPVEIAAYIAFPLTGARSAHQFPFLK